MRSPGRLGWGVGDNPDFDKVGIGMVPVLGVNVTTWDINPLLQMASDPNPGIYFQDDSGPGPQHGAVMGSHSQGFVFGMCDDAPLFTNFKETFRIVDDTSIRCFGAAVAGETPEFGISGFRAADALRTMLIGVGVDADDTASFDGVSAYRFDGTVQAGVGAGVGDLVSMRHDGTDAYFQTDDGDFVFQTDEGVNTNSTIVVQGKGTGRGIINILDEDNAEWITLTCVGGAGFIETAGTVPGILNLQQPAHADVTCFAGAGSGETPELTVSGFRAADALRVLQIGVGVDAADTVSFDGLSAYRFDGQIETANGMAGDRGWIRHNGNDMYFQTDDGNFIFETDETPNRNTVMIIQGSGTGFGVLRIFDEDNGERLTMFCTGDEGFITTVGASAGDLVLLDTAHANITMFEQAASGEVPVLQISGFRAGDALRTLSIGVGNTGANTASFSGLSIYRFNGNISITNKNELRFLDNGNYVGFEAPALSANQIWVLPAIDGQDGDVLSTDGAGTLAWASNASEKTWALSEVSGAGTHYIGGYYDFAATDNDFNPAVTHGTANSSYAAHAFLVQAVGAGGGDTTVQVSGTSIDDQGNRNAADTEDLVVDDAGAAGTYYETVKKWLGQVTFTKTAGPDLLCNYGFCKYWDNNNTDYTVKGIEATWTAGANDATPNILLRRHSATGWTYNNGAAPTPPTAIVDMNSDHVVEIQLVNGENGAWKRDNLNTDISGSTVEGTIIELITNQASGKSFEIGNILVRVVPQ